jgi:Ca2+-binding RTX toxin-like protein
LIQAGNGADSVTGGAGLETILLGNGNDVVNASGYTNAITVGSGTNTIVAGAGQDQVTAGAGVDTITLAGYNDTVTLNGGTATVSASQGAETVIANGGHDTLSFAGYNNLAEFMGTLSASVADTGGGLRIDVGSNTESLSLTGFGTTDTSGIIDLLNGVGGYASASSVVAALHSDGHNGTSLSLGSTGSIDFVNTTASQLRAANFAIG